MIPFFSILFSGILGACFGSFANVVALRFHEESSLGGRSRCPSCRTTLRPRHLIPIFSWVMLRGRCADCGVKIHIQYPIVELIVAILFVVAALRHPPFGSEFVLFAFEALISMGIVIMIVMDLRWKELPLEIMIGLGVVGFFFQLQFVFVHGWPALLPTLTTLLVAVAVPVTFFGAQWLLSRGRWLGSGDIWFGAMIALLVGTWQRTALALYLAYVVGGVVVGFLFAIGRIKRGMRIPFGPALATGLMLTMWCGSWLLDRFAYAF